MADVDVDRSSGAELLRDYLTERILLIGMDGSVLASHGRSTGLLGFDGATREAMHIAERVHPDDLHLTLALIGRARRGEVFEETVVVRARHKDGAWRRLEVAVFGGRLDLAPAVGVLRVRDVTDHVDGFEIGAARSRFVSLAEALPVGVLSADADDAVVFANDAAGELLAASFELLRGRCWLDRIRDDGRADVLEAVTTARSSHRTITTSFATTCSAETRWVEMTVVPLIVEGGCVGWIATLDNVTVEREVAHRATHDPLTGLPNRWLVTDRLDQALAKCARREDGVAVVFIDVDDLKSHNDICGHAAGDAVLTDVACRLVGHLRPSDTAGRLGGDEFVVIADVRNADEAHELGDRLRSLLVCEVAHGSTRLAVRASVGTSFTDDPTTTAAQLLAEADADMYRHKPNRRTPARQTRLT